MNGLNRFLVLLLALLIGGVAVVVLSVGAGLVTPGQLRVGYWLQEGLGVVATPGRQERLPAMAIAGGALVLSIMLLWFEVKTLFARRDPPHILLRSASNGSVTMSRAGVEHLAERVATEVDGVMEANARVVGREDIEVRCRARIDPASHAPVLAEELRARVKDAVEAHIGRPVARLSVHTQLESLNRYRSPSRVQ